MWWKSLLRWLGEALLKAAAQKVADKVQSK